MTDTIDIEERIRKNSRNPSVTGICKIVHGCSIDRDNDSIRLMFPSASEPGKYVYATIRAENRHQDMSASHGLNARDCDIIANALRGSQWDL